MKNIIKCILKKNKKVYKILKVFRFLYGSNWRNSVSNTRYPEILQFPITNTCNSKCIMCNVTSNILKNEMSVGDFKRIIQQDIFKHIKSVGINGGEPFLCRNLIPFIEILLEKGTLTSLNIISNGFLTETILEKCKTIYQLCKKHDVMFHLSFSLDGYGSIHDIVRGIPGSFDKTLRTIQSVEKEREKYCDSFDVGCTVIKQNVDYLVELKTFAELLKIKIKFRLGIQNRRLYNSMSFKTFDVLEDREARQSAKEFFFSLMLEADDIQEEYKYWAIFKFLAGNERRKLGCDWRDNGITLDGEGNIYYCAVQSPCIANLNKIDGEKAFFQHKNLEIRKKIIETKCSSCIHDYYGKPYIKDVFSLYNLFRLIKVTYHPF